LSKALAGIERRHWDRLPITIPFFVHGTYPIGQAFLEFATALNVSAGGVLLPSRKDFDCDKMVLLEIPTSIEWVRLFKTRTLFRAKIIRSLPTRNYFLLGMQFEPPLLPEADLGTPCDNEYLTVGFRS